MNISPLTPSRSVLMPLPSLYSSLCVSQMPKKICPKCNMENQVAVSLDGKERKGEWGARSRKRERESTRVRANQVVVCVCAYMCACVRVCVRARARVCMCAWDDQSRLCKNVKCKHVFFEKKEPKAPPPWKKTSSV